MSGHDQVIEGSERDVPSKYNVEGQRANNTDPAVQAHALPSASSGDSTVHDHEHEHDDQEHEKAESGPGGPGKGPVMEKYAYHCMSLIPSLHFAPPYHYTLHDQEAHSAGLEVASAWCGMSWRS